jgi:phage recombination protein Bet
MSNQIAIMAERLSVDPTELQNIVMNTVMPTSGNAARVTNEQFVSFLAVANEYSLNPMTKEIYAFPAKGGGVQPIVSIDGWLKIINSHKQFDGMEFEDGLDAGGKLQSITCRMFRKDRQHPTEVTEYLSECQKGNSEPWQKWPARMLRHKATIQAARYAFGFSGIVDPDEADRIQEAQSSEPKDMGSVEVVKELYPQEQFEKNFPKWEKLIQKGRKTRDEIIITVESKGSLTEEQKSQINNVERIAA